MKGKFELLNMTEFLQNDSVIFEKKIELQDGITIEVKSEKGIPYGKIAHLLLHFFIEENSKSSDVESYSIPDFLKILSLHDEDKDELIKQLYCFSTMRFCISQRKEYTCNTKNIFSENNDKEIVTETTGYINFFSSMEIENEKITYRKGKEFISFAARSR